MSLPEQTSARPVVGEEGLVLTVYILYLVGFITGVTALIGVIISHVKASSAGEVARSHFAFQIRTFWIGFLYLAVGLLLSFVVIGVPILIWWCIWTIVRIIKGMLLLNDGKPIANPHFMAVRLSSKESDMTQSPMDKKPPRTVIINGVCIVLAVVGLALVSNRLLDMAGIANEQGLSIDERKEKARRNDTEYAKTDESTTFNPVSWFSSEKFDCENQRVIETAKNQLLCERLLKCDSFGFQNLAEVYSATPKQLDQGSDEFVKRSAADALPLKQANPVLFDWFIKQMERIAEDRRKLYGLVPTFLTDVSIVADDFNPQIGKYLCRMTYQYNEAVFVPFWDSTLRLNLLGDPTAQAGYQAELEKSRESASFELAVKLGMQKFRAYESAQERRTETLRFTVQPSQQSRFAVQVIEMHMPGGRLVDQ